MIKKTEDDKVKDIEHCIELFDKHKIGYHIGNTQDGRFFCGHDGESLFDPEFISTDINRKSYNSWYGKNKYDAIMKASMSYWAMQYMMGNEDI